MPFGRVSKAMCCKKKILVALFDLGILSGSRILTAFGDPAMIHL